MQSLRQRRWIWLRLAGLILALSVGLGACTRGPIDHVGPVEAVQRFVAGLEARDPSAIIALLEPTEWRREIGPELRIYLNYLEQIAIEAPVYTVVENTGDTAVVRVTGTLVYAIAERDTDGTYGFDLLIDLVRIDEAWYLRSLQLPQPGVER